MTRVNVGIDPQELPNKLLLAEHREITRIPNAVKRGKINLKSIPESFTLGTGHVKFFYFKMGYLKARYISLYKECVRRGFNVTSKSSAFDGLPMIPWEPEGWERELIVARIEEKGFSLKETTHD